MLKCPYCHFKTGDYRGLRIHQAKVHGTLKVRIKLWIRTVKASIKKEPVII